ncbi:MAG: pyruvate kinase [Phycisphaerales bacterium]
MPAPTNAANDVSRIERPPLTKIVATVGPASDSQATLERLIDSGVSIFRLNFSHGSTDEHKRRLETIRAAASAMGRCIGVLGDLPGPKIRVGTVPDIDEGGGIDVQQGQHVLLDRTITVAEVREETIDDRCEIVPALPLTYGDLVDEVQPGQRVLINDGAIRMLAVGLEPGGAAVRCVVTMGGKVTTRKGINLPETELKVPALTDRDRELVRWSVAHELDYLALSFVRSGKEIEELRDLVAAEAPDREPIPIIAKIEKPQALSRIDEIAEVADAIMVARGDLGVEMDIPEVPPAQKRIIAAAGHWGKPCIVATQMLETMIESAIPTRAEASDVANAIFDRAGAVMLSGETAVGKHPVLVVETMARIARATEAAMAQSDRGASPPQRLKQTRYRTAALAHGAWHLANDLDAKAIVCWSQLGGTARYLSQNDFDIPIIAWSSDPAATRRMALLRGVRPVLAQPPESGRLADWTDMVEAHLLEHHWAKAGDQVLLVAGRPLGVARVVNSLSVLELGDPTGGYRQHH